MSDFIQAEEVVSTALGLLHREITLPQLVWRDAVGNFRGVKDDTYSLRLPAWAPARTRALRSGASRTKDTIHERKVNVTLTTDIYKDIPISDEELSLDIVNFGTQVLNPVLIGVVEQLETGLANLMSNASYENTIAHVASTDDPYETAVRAGEYLDNAHVPVNGRVLVCGSKVRTEFLLSDRFTDASKSGTTATLRNGVIGDVADFTVYRSPALPANEAYAFHRTAYVMSQRAPIVPMGAPWGASSQYEGMAIRTVRSFDPDEVEDRFIADAWVGYNTVKDHGHYTDDPDDGGKFVPVEDPDDPEVGHTDDWDNDAARLVRAVKITLS